MRISALECRRAIRAIHLAIQEARKEKFVFLGGGLVPLLVTDPAAAPLRPTKDVDVVVSVATRGQYSYMRQDLLNAGFHDNASIDKPVCALFYGEWRVDFLCAEPGIIDADNRWFPAVMAASLLERIEDVEIWRASTPTWMATKLEAWFNRGRLRSGALDYLHQDIEDILAVIDGRPECVEEMRRSSDEVGIFLGKTLGMLAADSDFQSALPGHVGGEERAVILLGRIQEMLR